MAETDPRNLSSEDDVSETRPPADDDSAADGSAPLKDWSAGQVILDDYVVERELGQGGMGKVYLLRSRSTGRPFAVKRAFLRNENSRRDFLAELRTWIDLPEHPHLVACRFFRTVGDEVVIFAEFVDGGSLADWIWDRRLTGLEQILGAAIQFAWGLHAAHELGLVHQDVKPGNALMTADGQVKVADFGLARNGSRRRFRTAAPERIPCRRRSTPERGRCCRRC
jgi:serine/threonine protein kinase